MEASMSATVLEFVSLPESARLKAVAPPEVSLDDSIEIVVRHRDGTSEARGVPEAAAKLVRHVLERLYAGGKIAVLEEERELTPNEASEILGMSRPLVVRRMDAGDLPFRYVGAHRRCRLSDVLTFKIKEAERQKVVEAMAADSDDLKEAYGL
jgi:excisionase family DNA binding protein